MVIFVPVYRPRLIQAIILMLFPMMLSAQTSSLRESSSLGIYSAIQGSGISWEISSDSRNSSNIKLILDTYGVLSGRCNPGVKLNYSRNTRIGKSVEFEGATLSYYMGPGVSLGWVRDHDGSPFQYFNYDVQSRYGLLMAMSFSGGVRLDTRKRISLMLEFGVDLGVHLTPGLEYGSRNLLLYRNSLNRFYLPSFTISYKL